MRFDTPRARRAVLGAGALFTISAPVALAAGPDAPPASPAAPPPAAAKAAKGPVASKASASLTMPSVRRHVVAGRSVIVKGVLRPVSKGRRVTLQVKGEKGWSTVDKARTGSRGRYRLTYKAPRPGSRTLRVRFAGTDRLKADRRTIGRANTYRRAFASWYGPGLYGNALGCGGRLSPGTIGVAHKSMPCGTRLTLRKGNRTVRARVIDRGPYIAGREFDLTAATKQRLGFGSTGTILVTR